MTRPEDAPTAGPDAREGEPGHRARAYAAALLGELTGTRRGGDADTATEPAPQPGRTPDPTGPAAVPDLAASTLVVDREQEPASDRGADAVEHEQDGQDALPDAPGPVPAEAGAQSPVAEPLDEPSPAAQAETVTTTLRQDSPVVPAPVRGDAALARPAAPADQQASGPRPSPFTYVEVAAHHTGPARATAHGALDAAGARITSRADREAVRRAARTAVEATALLDACDALDARARAVDGTWNGERHGATEVREFEGAWGAFYDTSSALSSSTRA